MIINVDEFKAMGFSSDDDKLTEDCIKRAEFVLNGLSGGRAIPVSKMGGAAADYVKQACAFQANAIIREENALRAQNSESEQKTDSNVEKVSIGDFSYSYSTSRSDSSQSKNTDIEPLDTNFTVIRLLRAAGCLYSGTEVRE
ncbi:MAG: hypothetical protein J1F03_04395 [Oscillospiraceae bacterium]|nr:hypothetical protein [Oscillospiraceae bacterium]